MKRKIHIFILFLFISSNLSAGKPKNKIKSKVYGLNKDARGHEKGKIYPNNERPKRSLKIEEPRRLKEEGIAEISDPFKEPNKIYTDNSRDRRALSTENFSSFQEISEAGQAKSYNLPFDTNRQQIDAEPFWNNRGSSYTDNTGAVPFIGKDVGVIKTEHPFQSAQEKTKDSALSFWGNRGRQVNYMIGNSGFAQYRRMDEYPSLNGRDRRDQDDAYWSKGSRRQEQSRKLRYLLSKGVLNNNKDTTTFWKNRGRDSQMRHLFEPNVQAGSSSYAESNTVLNNDFYADQPHYVIVERTSRSSGEEDPFVISRGKKKVNELDWIRWRKAVRDRRGTIESIFKTVNADPFFIARGKKYDEENDSKLQNVTIRYQDIVKVKELVCSTIELMNPENSKSKREVVDRGEKNVLKALAAQLQNDPYYVSRGKKDFTDKTEEKSLKEFMEEMANLCN